METLSISLPTSISHLFPAVSDHKVRVSNAPDQPTYRLVRFSLAGTHFFLLTNRFALTTFEIILIYAYCWQIELLFRFLKHTLPGLHLLSTSKKGVTIQFYLLLISALLQLHLKQACVEAVLESALSDPPVADASLIAERAVTETDGQLFLAAVGDNLYRSWRIFIH